MDFDIKLQSRLHLSEFTTSDCLSKSPSHDVIFEGLGIVFDRWQINQGCRY